MTATVDITTLDLLAELAAIERRTLADQARSADLLSELYGRMNRSMTALDRGALPIFKLCLRHCSNTFGISESDILGPRRMNAIVEARHAAMLLTRELLPKVPVQRLAELFCKPDHGTVLHAVRSARDRAETDPSFRRRLEVCRVAVNAEKDKPC